jgi:hypothetical protein
MNSMIRSSFTPYLITVLLGLCETGCTTPFQVHYEAVSHSAMCPSSSGVTLPVDAIKQDGSVWVPQTACEAAIVQMAVDRCIGASTTTSDIYNAGSVSRGAGIGLNAASSAFDGIISSVMGLITNPLLTSATLVATLGTSIARVFSGSTSSSLSIKNMYAAAGSYSLNNQKLAKDETYYKGLWNAVGSVCPPNPILGGFEMEKSDTGYSAPVTSP